MGDFGLNQTLEYVELCLDSWDCISRGGGQDAILGTYNWPQFHFSSRKLNVAALKVLQAEIPFVFDVITEFNNTFTYTAAGTPYTITIPKGTYTGPTLATQLQTLMAAVTVGFLVTWNSSTLKLTFTYPNASAWSLTFASRLTAYSPLGFTVGTYSATGAGSKITSNSVSQVTGPYYLYINSNQIGSLVNFNLADGSITGGIGPEICRIPINVQYGSVIFYTDPCKY